MSWEVLGTPKQCCLQLSVFFFSLLLYYLPACMEAQMAVPAESTFSNCYLGIYDSLLTSGEQEKLVIFRGIILRKTCSSTFPSQKTLCAPPGQ